MLVSASLSSARGVDVKVKRRTPQRERLARLEDGRAFIFELDSQEIEGV
jgi:hypothetical protein